jgi:N-acetylmuramoyl-L-alanine amidase
MLFVPEHIYKSRETEGWKTVSQKQYKVLSMIMAALLVLSMLVVGRETARYVVGNHVVVEEAQPCVVIDAGHGGMDPGKVGINGALEKDINLKIAMEVKTLLEKNDICVIMTRDEDKGLYDEGAGNKKVQDMKRRIALIEEAEPVLTVSIHQNSYPEEYVHGAQVFYYNGSAEGSKLAERIQERLVCTIDPENTRQIKGNDTYYLLKKTQSPIVIVECGFLSNTAEAEKLCSEYYQEKLAWAIHIGILQYLNTGN